MEILDSTMLNYMKRVNEQNLELKLMMIIQLFKLQ
ncbi:hypothetical protein KSF78_0004547 [Schistosoma japonicum]|nr:hypothetical protein KSF78_0004547 [Schistosoma japonicum]